MREGEREKKEQAPAATAVPITASSSRASPLPPSLLEPALPIPTLPSDVMWRVSSSEKAPGHLLHLQARYGSVLCVLM